MAQAQGGTSERPGEKRFAVAVGAMFATVFGWPLVLGIASPWFDRAHWRAENVGTLGDSYGVLTALFTGATLLYMARQLALQRQDLALQRDELTESRAVAEESAAHLKRQAEMLEYEHKYRERPAVYVDLGMEGAEKSDAGRMGPYFRVVVGSLTDHVAIDVVVAGEFRFDGTREHFATQRFGVRFPVIPARGMLETLVELSDDMFDVMQLVNANMAIELRGEFYLTSASGARYRGDVLVQRPKRGEVFPAYGYGLSDMSFTDGWPEDMNPRALLHGPQTSPTPVDSHERRFFALT